MFVRDMEGTLMEIGESAETRYRYIVWFDYTRRAINEMQEGTLLAVPNFASNGSIKHFSVLEVTTILPTHYALQGGSDGYPGFVVEAARSASEDWEAQDETSTEDTTKIHIVAIPTNLEIVEPLSGEPTIGPESNIAMVGSRVRILDSEYSNLIANNGIDRQNEKNLTVIGSLTRDDKVEILLRIEELYRTHFAIFGFTGVGKSNLLSTIVAKVLNDATEPLKLVFFDLMSEYTGLLLDQLLDDKVQGRILTVGRRTLPEGLFRHINELRGAPSLDDAARQLVRYTLLPKALASEKKLVAFGLRDLIAKKKIHFYHEAQSLTVWDLFFTDAVDWAKGRQTTKFNQRKDLCTKALRAAGVKDYKATKFSPELVKKIREAITAELDQPTGAEFKKDGDFSNHFAKLDELETSTTETFAAGVTLDEIIDDLNDKSHPSLWVIQAHNPNELRSFSKRLGEAIYERRRQDGIIDPLVSFIFDEADEFVRNETAGSYGESREIAETLARRGRKFGLGLGIATQRIRYLDTSIMAQPHTYFVSKLPRLTDRQAVAEAFGVGEDFLNQTFKFKKGMWLLMSHDATGLEAIPVPVKTPDANRRLSDWLRKTYGMSVN
jgi:DNA helicase HerA-like ATPase